MNIGMPRERRPNEYRVGLTPAGVELLKAGGHACYVEKEAGKGTGFSDVDYERVRCDEPLDTVLLRFLSRRQSR